MELAAERAQEAQQAVALLCRELEVEPDDP
jgi:hypothetical protein